MSYVDLAELNRIGQLFDRQRGYFAQGQTFVAANCVPRGYTGLLSYLAPHYQACYDAGTTGLGHGVQITEKCASTIRANQQQYLSDDRASSTSLGKYGDLPPGGKRPPGSSGPDVWGGVKSVTSGAKWVGDNVGRTVSGANGMWNWQEKRADIDALGKPVKDGSKLFGADTKKWEDPWGTVKKKASERLADAIAARRGYWDNADYDATMRRRFQSAYVFSQPDGHDSYAQTPRASRQNALNLGLDALQKPGQVVSGVDGVIEGGRKVAAEIARAGTISHLRTTGSSDSGSWATTTGGNW
ncbi:MAG TPA: hypothetical protein PLX71_06585 [Phycicoccus sp.]|nr:hypothetical protein [Phycicoccus sp.]